MKKWLVRNTDNALAMKLKTDTGLPMLLCSLLVGRGIYTACLLYTSKESA